MDFFLSSYRITLENLLFLIKEQERGVTKHEPYAKNNWFDSLYVACNSHLLSLLGSPVAIFSYERF
jgi:hypothetical protein